MAESMRAFVVGHPIAHSRSPLIHGHWLERHGISGSYEAVDVAPADLPSFLKEMTARGFRGGNVTIPHKEAVHAAVARCDAAAELIGAVNTLWHEDGVLVGGNTDAAGFAANLDDHAPQWRGTGSALVVGAGGAARAVVFALLEGGFAEVHVANRTAERAGELADRFGRRVSAHGLDALPELIPTTGLIVNTAAAGMEGRKALEIDFSAAPPGAIATDIVYVPLQTDFLKRAARHGVVAVDGLGMLLHQAVPGFERWFGMQPAVTAELRRLVVDDLERHP